MIVNPGGAGSKTPYQYAVDGGYTGTEAEFQALMGSGPWLPKTATAAAAAKLATSRTVRTNLASTSAASFNGTANVTPGVTGVLPVANGGTGSSTEKYLPLAGGTVSGVTTFSGNANSGEVTTTDGVVIQGNLRLKGSGNFGNTLRFGDGDYVHLSEPTDDCLEIKAKTVNFVTTQTPGVTVNGAALGGASSETVQIGTGSVSCEDGTVSSGYVHYASIGDFVLLNIYLSVVVTIGTTTGLSFTLSNIPEPINLNSKPFRGPCFASDNPAYFSFRKLTSPSVIRLDVSSNRFSNGNSYEIVCNIPYVKK